MAFGACGNDNVLTKTRNEFFARARKKGTYPLEMFLRLA
jgi:hypothetical protein